MPMALDMTWAPGNWDASVTPCSASSFCTVWSMVSKWQASLRQQYKRLSPTCTAITMDGVNAAAASVVHMGLIFFFCDRLMPVISLLACLTLFIKNPAIVVSSGSGVFLKSSRGGASMSWERKNFSGGVIGGKNPVNTQAKKCMTILLMVIFRNYLEPDKTSISCIFKDNYNRRLV